MKKFSDLVQDNGSITEDGRKLLEPLSNALESILYTPAMRELSDVDLKLFESVLFSKISEAVSKKMTHKKTNTFDYMSDEQFSIYLKNKYGEGRSCLKSLTKEEFDRLPPIPDERIKEIINAAREARISCEEATPHFHPNKNIYYK